MGTCRTTSPLCVYLSKVLVVLRLMRLPRNINTSDKSVVYEVCIFIVTLQIKTIWELSDLCLAYEIQRQP